MVVVGGVRYSRLVMLVVVLWWISVNSRKIVLIDSVSIDYSSVLMNCGV